MKGGDWYEKRRDDLSSKLSTLDSFARHYNPVFDVAPYLSHSFNSSGGNYHIHRSLGVHISFVRSIAMDSWTPAQMEIMKTGGNQKCQSYLSAKGILPSTPIKQKYENDVAQLYKEIVKARAEGELSTLVLIENCIHVSHI